MQDETDIICVPEGKKAKSQISQALSKTQTDQPRMFHTPPALTINAYKRKKKKTGLVR